MAFNWPISPTEGQIYTPVGGPTYVFNSPVWKAMGQGQIAIVSDSAPANPANGQLWWESDTGILFVYVNDGNSSQWVQCGGIQEASDLSSVSADMSIGFRTSVNRFVVNDKADLSGTDVMAVSDSGALTATGQITSGGAVTANGTITANSGAVSGFFIGGTTNVAIGPSVAGGTIFLRPTNYGSATGQTSIDSSGNMNVAGTITSGNQVAGVTVQAGTFSATGASNGQLMGGANITTSRNLGTTAGHIQFYNTSGGGVYVGQINTNGTATNYLTSSDANMKDVQGSYDPQEAIAIIRADPVKTFTWKTTGDAAVGWLAQQSYAVHPNLAEPPEPPENGKQVVPFGEEGYQPWGIDYGKRTPYLWAAVTALLDEVEALKARIAVLEGTAA